MLVLSTHLKMITLIYVSIKKKLIRNIFIKFL